MTLKRGRLASMKNEMCLDAYYARLAAANGDVSQSAQMITLNLPPSAKTTEKGRRWASWAGHIDVDVIDSLPPLEADTPRRTGAIIWWCLRNITTELARRPSMPDLPPRSGGADVHSAQRGVTPYIFCLSMIAVSAYVKYPRCNTSRAAYNGARRARQIIARIDGPV